jgi:ABC-type multidrug transport system ATPase subunit
VESGTQLKLEARNLGHRYGARWLFRGLILDLGSPEVWVVRGPNGAGKSTLLRILAAQTEPAEGSLHWHRGTRKLDPEQLYTHLSWSSPAVELYGDLTLMETLQLHFGLKQCLLDGPHAVLQTLELELQRNLPVKRLSSGQQQRLRLGLALFSAGQLLVLDEPTAFLDEQQAARALKLIDHWRQGRLYLLASNRPEEYIHLAEARYIDILPPLD